MIDDKTRGVLEGLVDTVTHCRATLLMYAPHLPAETPVLRSTAFWADEARKLLNSPKPIVRKQYED